MPQGALLSILVAHMVLPSFDNQLVDHFPHREERELSEHYFGYSIKSQWTPQFTADVLPGTWWWDPNWWTVKLTSAPLLLFAQGEQQNGNPFSLFPVLVSYPTLINGLGTLGPVQLFLSQSEEFTQNSEHWTKFSNLIPHESVILWCEAERTPAQVAQSSCGYPSPGSGQGQAGGDLEQPEKMSLPMGFKVSSKSKHSVDLRFWANVNVGKKQNCGKCGARWVW